MFPFISLLVCKLKTCSFMLKLQIDILPSQFEIRDSWNMSSPCVSWCVNDYAQSRRQSSIFAFLLFVSSVCKRTLIAHAHHVDTLLAPIINKILARMFAVPHKFALCLFCCGHTTNIHRFRLVTSR